MEIDNGLRGSQAGEGAREGCAAERAERAARRESQS
jgi:hypothetical protein